MTVAGHDIVSDYRQTRSMIGLVPQEIQTDAWVSVLATVRYSRGLFGRKPDEAYLEGLLKELSLWDKRDAAIVTLSGGMKRRLLIAKALSHEPEILFLDEPTAGVDVELRRDMWNMVRRLKERGVTIILTTHYIEEAEEMADRVGVINKGEIVLVDHKDALMRRMGTKQLRVQLREPIQAVPAALADYKLELTGDGCELVYTYDTQGERTGITALFSALSEAGVRLRDISTSQSTLEQIFVSLVEGKR